MASSMSRTELSRATASGMNELGKSTVSRSGSTRELWRNRERPFACRDLLEYRGLVLIAHGAILLVGPVVWVRETAGGEAQAPPTGGACFVGAAAN